MEGGVFRTTSFLCFGLHRSVCCRAIGGIFLVQWDVSHCEAQVEFHEATQHYRTMLKVTNMGYVQYGIVLAYLEQ